MSIATTLKETTRFVLLYGTTPPRLGSSQTDVVLVAAKLAARIKTLPLDGIVVYDVQDESSRISEPRPFPFLPTVDSRVYSKILNDLTGVPTITYKCVARMTKEDWEAWLTETAHTYGCSCLSLVGSPTATVSKPPMTLSQAARIAASRQHHFTLGGVCIAERHKSGKSESQRMLQKAADGCAFFISQAIYSPDTTVQLLKDYWFDCQRSGVAPKRIVLTFTPCGRPKTLAFIKWLGVNVAQTTEQAILSSANPVAKSIQICCENLSRILDQDFCHSLPLGINVESVSINKLEIDGSIELFHALQKILQGRDRLPR
jgi:5,10-methylenetetrahydrofolate reductase